MKRLFMLAALVLVLFTGAQPAQASPSALEVARHSARAHAAELVAAAAPATVTVHAGDTYGRWALTYCGTFTAWPAIQQANGWPERRIPVGARAVIVCSSSSATPAAPTSSAEWVHPLASGKHGNSCYGWRSSTHSFHGGVDMAQPWGTPIRAVTSGVVHRKAYEPRGAGYYLVVKHPGNLYTLYAHMPSPSPLAIGAAVSVGQTIGRVGSTGNSTGPHLHFEVRKGGSGSSHRINPAPFMRNHGVNIGC